MSTRESSVRALSLAILFALGCGDDSPAGTTPPESETDRPRPPAPDRDPDPDPLAGLDDPVTSDEVVPPIPTGPATSPATLEAAVPRRGCVSLTELPVKVWAEPGPSTIAAHAGAFVVAGYAPREGGGEDLWLVTLSPSSPPRPLRRLPVEPRASAGRIAPPALASDGTGHLLVAGIDGRGRVRAADIATNDPLAEVALGTVAEGADQRFAPAAAALARHRLIAWTDGTGTPMRVRLAMLGLDGTVTARHDVTPQSMGASAPAFAAGVSPPALYFVDARAGVSPIVRVEITADGAPREAAVARPVGTVTTPPRLAVARAGNRTFAGYTAVGNAAATAVGYVPLESDDSSPAAIVPGTGYGELHVSAAPGPRAVIFAADAPTAAPPESPREVHVRIVDAQGAGPVLALRAPDGSASDAAIARGAGGVLGVSATAGDGVYVFWARCDDGG